MKTYILNDLDTIIEELENMSNEELVSVHNQYCENNNDMDSQIFNNDEEFIEMFFSGRVVEFQRACEYGDYKYRDTFVQFNGYANLDSFDYVGEHIDTEAIATDIQENERSYYNIELEEQEEIDEPDAVNEYREAALKFFRIMNSTACFISPSTSPHDAAWAVWYRLGLAICEGMSITDRAEELGISPQALSKQIWEFCESAGIPESPYMYKKGKL